MKGYFEYTMLWLCITFSTQVSMLIYVGEQTSPIFFHKSFICSWQPDFFNLNMIEVPKGTEDLNDF